MKTYLSVLVLGLLMPSSAVDANTNPIAKVVSMIADLQQEVINEGAAEQKVYNEYSKMCSERSRELHQEMKNAKARMASLVSTIEKSAADLDVLQEQISSSASDISDTESDLKRASSLREKEAADFKVEEQELVSTISTVERAISIIEREGPSASLVQVEHMQSVTQVLQTMVEASMVDSYDAAKLTALVQSSSAASEDSDDSDEDQETGAPSAAAFKGQSGGIVETLEGLNDKSQQQLEEGRSAEVKAKNAYEMVSQSLQDKGKTLTGKMADAKKSLAATKEAKAGAEGELDTTKKGLAEDTKDLGDLHHACLSKATAFEDDASGRNEELKALSTAKKIIVESTGGALVQTYGVAQPSFLQVRELDTAGLSSSSDALHVVRNLAMTVRSEALVDLSNRISKAIQKGANTGKDPFNKVRSMINSMIEKLEAEASAGAEKKAYCDKEMAESQKNQDVKTDALEKLNTNIDIMASNSKKLKGQVSVINKELGSLARTQAEMDKLRVEEKALYKKSKPELERGLEGVKTALKVLREYYAKDDSSSDSSGAGGGIVGMLEVVESDFSKGLANIVSAERSSQEEYEVETHDNNIAKATKGQDKKGKIAEHIGLDKSITEAQADRSGVNDELAAVNEYFASIKKECVAKPDTYEEKVKRREKEMVGLKNALETLQGETVLLQQTTSHKTLRGRGARLA